MTTIDQIYYKDFKRMMQVRANSEIDIPLQVLAEGINAKIDKNMGYIKNITEPFYEKLNKSTCHLLFKTKVGKPQVTAEGAYRVDENGNEVVDHVPVPRECILIRSSVNIHLKRTMDDGTQYEENELFRYIRYKDVRKDGRQVRYYYYIVPREFVSRLNMNAVILTKNKRRNYYYGMKVALVDGSYAFLYVVPDKGVRDDTITLYTGATTEFGAHIVKVVEEWMRKGYAFNYDLLEVDLPDKGTFNMGYQLQGSTLFAEDYVKFTGTLKEEQDITVIE